MTAPPPRTPGAGETGAIVLPAYRPDPALLRRQLESIRDQTVAAFVCVVGADGDPAVGPLVRGVVGNDDRFRVIDFDRNVGLYRNVERLLAVVPPSASWVALSDQDDRWYPGKLEVLLPHLANNGLVLGQAAVVDRDGRTCGSPTSRRHVALDLLVFENQITGSLCVFRRSLLDIALPFPPHHAPTQMHDHWLGVCAAATNGYEAVDVLVQDYVQHGANLVGENIRRRRDPVRALREIVAIADEYEGGHSLVECARACRDLSFGWRRTVVDALIERLPDPPRELLLLREELRPASGVRPLVRMMRRVAQRQGATRHTLDQFVPGLPGELATRLRVEAATLSRRVQHG
jgi:hypothetical protein